ncbi:hypothetical protein M513_09286 [Trichuris suis]|uniref:Uncharacterized protein n=1 Tax=Trichuris suis TaxID=68888 RepID=A0A085LXX3_9BILA|nr:hypothetical protein M513_09286 [Trichuris suis]
MTDATLLPYFQIRTELSVHDGSVLCGRQHIVVPEALRHALVGVAHESRPSDVRKLDYENRFGGPKWIFWWNRT